MKLLFIYLFICYLLAGIEQLSLKYRTKLLPIWPIEGTFLTPKDENKEGKLHQLKMELTGLL